MDASSSLQNVQPKDVRVFRAGHAAALGLGVFNVIKNLPGNPLAGGQNRDSGGIAHDELAAHMALALPQRQAHLFGVEGLLGGSHHDGVDVLLFEKVRTVPVVSALDFCQSADQPLQLLRAVTDGQVGQNVADVAELNLNVVFIPENVIDLNAGQTDASGVDAELGGVKIEDGVAVAQLLAEGVVTADGVDFLPGVLCHILHLVENLPSPEGQIPAGDVQTAHEQIAAGGGDINLDECVLLLRTGLAEFPGNERIMHKLACVLNDTGWQRHTEWQDYDKNGNIVYCFDTEKTNEYWNEAKILFETLILNTSNNEIKANSIYNLIMLYRNTGEYQKAINLANTLPQIRYSKEIMLSLSTDGKQQSGYLGDSLLELAYMFAEQIIYNLVSNKSNFDTDMPIEKVKGAISNFELLAEDGFLGIYHREVCYLYLYLSRLQYEKDMKTRHLFLLAKH